MAKKGVKKITKIEPVSNGPAANAVEVKRVGAYCRVSTNSVDQKNSFEAQVDYYTRLIGEKEGWVLAGIYADEARSGTKLYRRDDFQQMMQDCWQGKIDLILTKSVTRFARNTVDSIKAIRELKAFGIAVYFEKKRGIKLEEVLIARYDGQNLPDSCFEKNSPIIFYIRLNGSYLPLYLPETEYRLEMIKKLEFFHVDERASLSSKENMNGLYSRLPCGASVRELNYLASTPHQVLNGTEENRDKVLDVLEAEAPSIVEETVQVLKQSYHQSA